MCSNKCDNEKDAAIDFVSSGSGSNKLSFSVSVCCVIFSSWELACCVMAVYPG